MLRLSARRIAFAGRLRPCATVLQRSAAASAATKLLQGPFQVPALQQVASISTSSAVRVGEDSKAASAPETASNSTRQSDAGHHGDEKFNADTPFTQAIWYITLASAVGFASYLGYRGWTDYFSPAAKTEAEDAVRAIPLVAGNPVVFLDLAFEGQDLGRIVLQLRRDQAPKTAENFRRLCTGERGFGLRGSRFHALVPGSYLAGGDIVHGTGEGGKSALGVPFPPEKNSLRHIGPGILSMAGPGPDYTSQFAISLAKGPLMDGRFPTFGNVIDGFDVLKSAEEAVRLHQR